MAQRLPTPCRHHGCPELTLEPYCAEHKGEDHRRQDEWRGSSTERGYDGKWRKARKRWLAEHPLCARCEEAGLVVAARLVHHKDRNPRNNRAGNLESLCVRCHELEHVSERAGNV